MAEDKKPEEKKNIIIIIKRKKGGHGGHHGGAWKVAYADFVTAMMAFFLLLWLLNATSQEQKLGISNYFEPIRVVPNSGSAGSNGVLGGKSVQSQEKMETDQSTPMQEHATASSPVDPVERTDEGMNEAQPGKITVEEAKEILKEDEKKEFNKIEAKIRNEIEGIPDLKKLSDSLIMDQTEEGLRIQITDRDKYSMFPNGSSMMYSYTKRLVELVSRALLPLPNLISVSGHTDSVPYSVHKGYTNWELSSDRANACRRVMNEIGISDQRIRDVIGHAENQPLDPQNAGAPSNRRISIVLLWTSKKAPPDLSFSLKPVGSDPAPAHKETSPQKQSLKS
jgi:chemotaxis protein MotB